MATKRRTGTTITMRAGKGEDLRDVIKTLSKVPDERASKLLAHVRKFIDDQDITCGEAVYQSDRVIENAYEFIDGCCKIVGYKERSDG